MTRIGSANSRPFPFVIGGPILSNLGVEFGFCVSSVKIIVINALTMSAISKM